MAEKYQIKKSDATDISALIKEGKFDYASDYASKFPFEATTANEIELVHFDRYIKSEDAVKELDVQGLRPATASELLLLAIQHPDLQRKNYIVALGTVRQIGDFRLVAYLSGGSSARYLYVRGWDEVWGDGWRFAAVRKDIQKTSDAGNLGVEKTVDPLEGVTVEQVLQQGIAAEKQSREMLRKYFDGVVENLSRHPLAWEAMVKKVTGKEIERPGTGK